MERDTVRLTKYDRGNVEISQDGIYETRLFRFRPYDILIEDEKLANEL